MKPPSTGRPITKLAAGLHNQTDLRAEQTYLDRHPLPVAAVELGGIRTAVFVPMLKQNEVVGLISIYRQEVRPFTDKQIALVTNFASQAVIARERPAADRAAGSHRRAERIVGAADGHESTRLFDSSAPS